MFRFLPFLSCLLCLPTFAQQTNTSFPALGIGEWQQHLPWQRSYSVTQSKDKAYFSTEWAVVEIDKKERTPRFLTKVEGLSDVGVRLVRYGIAYGTADSTSPQIQTFEPLLKLCCGATS